MLFDLYIGASHWAVLQQRAVIDSSSFIQEVPEHGGSRAAVSVAELWAARHNNFFLQVAVGLEMSGKRQKETLLIIVWYLIL